MLSHVDQVSYEDFYSLKPTITRDEYEQFLNCSRKMIVSQWVTGCGYTTLQTLFHLLRLLR